MPHPIPPVQQHPCAAHTSSPTGLCFAVRSGPCEPLSDALCGHPVNLTLEASDRWSVLCRQASSERFGLQRTGLLQSNQQFYEKVSHNDLLEVLWTLDERSGVPIRLNHPPAQPFSLCHCCRSLNYVTQRVALCTQIWASTLKSIKHVRFRRMHQRYNLRF